MSKVAVVAVTLLEGEWVSMGLTVLSRFHSHGYENRKQRRKEVTVKPTVRLQLAIKMRREERGEREKQRNTGHVNHAPGSEFFKVILARS